MSRAAVQAAQPETPTLSSHLLQGAARSRCGLVRPAQPIEPNPCDATGPLFEGRRVHNAATPADPANPWQGVSGAVALDAEAAADGAVAEALERLAAAQADVEVRRREALTPAHSLGESAFALFSPRQRATPGFPWPMPEHDDDLFAAVYALDDNRVAWGRAVAWRACRRRPVGWQPGGMAVMAPGWRCCGRPRNCWNAMHSR
jgi:ribosomal protein S12 methylthiotransferase accessory factor